MVKINKGLASLVAAGAIALNGCSANYFGNITPGVEIGNVGEKNCKTYSIENVTLGETEMYHLALKSRRGEIIHGFYRDSHSIEEIVPSCEKTPSIISNEQRENKRGLYLLEDKGDGAVITLKRKVEFNEFKPMEKTGVLEVGRITYKNYNLNELFKENRALFPGDEHPYFVFSADEIKEPIDSVAKKNESPAFLPWVFVDARVLMRRNRGNGEVSFVNESGSKKEKGKIKVLKFYSEEKVKKKLLGYKN